MDWIQNLLFATNSVAHTVILYAFVIALGVYLGKLKIFGISLGVTFVLFVGLFVSHFGFTAEQNILHFTKEFGLILFVYSIGLQVGPGFFSSFKRGGMQLNLLAVGVVLLNLIVVCVIYAISHDRVSMPELVGILSGAVTNTPGLGAAQQTLSQLQFDGKLTEIPEIASGYAAAYPLGVIGIILAMIIVRYLFRINNDEETKRLEAEKEASTLVPHIVTYKVENPLIVGRTLEKLALLIDRNFVVSRIQKEGEVMIPDDNTIIGRRRRCHESIYRSDCRNGLGSYSLTYRFETYRRYQTRVQRSYSGFVTPAHGIPVECDQTEPCRCRPARYPQPRTANGRPPHGRRPARRYSTAGFSAG